MRRWLFIVCGLAATACGETSGNDPLSALVAPRLALSTSGVVIHDLEFDGTAIDVNNRGQVVGVLQSGPDNEAFFWEKGVLTPLGTLDGPGGSSSAEAINNRGQVVGTSISTPTGLRGFLWEDGVMIGLGTLGGDVSGDFSDANDINDAGHVVGVSRTTSGQDHAVLWKTGKPIDLGTLPGSTNSSALAINNRGQIVGVSIVGGETHATLWEKGVITDLGTLGGDFSVAQDINERGEIIGESRLLTGFTRGLLVDRGGSLFDLGVLGGTFSNAIAINNRGVIAGVSTIDDPQFIVHAVIWKEGEIFDLGTLEGLTQSVARGINDNGQVVGISSSGEFRRAVLWELSPNLK